MLMDGFEVTLENFIGFYPYYLVESTTSTSTLDRSKYFYLFMTVISRHFSEVSSIYHMINIRTNTVYMRNSLEEIWIQQLDLHTFF